MLKVPAGAASPLKTKTPGKQSIASQLSKRSRKPVPAEDDWALVGNPDNYLDKLPQPYRFLNECLQDLILKPVFNDIVQIE